MPLVQGINYRVQPVSGRRIGDADRVVHVHHGAHDTGVVEWWPLFGPSVSEDDVDKVVAHERWVEVLQHIRLHRAEGAVRPCLIPSLNAARMHRLKSGRG
jgi:hypothetical protein